ncbi:hypothetical protein QQF64_013179 [Cirrhinus molitorella]|uniref:Uncharacterized protein n=1 Tax=Cirrhinus molitorella TaxID=172907 RepID=A0ABR3LQD9_9TELE
MTTLLNTSALSLSADSSVNVFLGLGHLITMCLTHPALYRDCIRGSSLNHTPRRQNGSRNSRSTALLSLCSDGHCLGNSAGKQADKSVWAPPTAPIRQSDGRLQTPPLLIYASRQGTRSGTETS